MYSDAWIFTSIRGDGKKADLPDIIGSADFYNRTLPTWDELSSALNAFAHAGLIDHTDGYYWLTKRGIQVRRQASKGVKTAAEVIARLQSILPPLLPRHPDEPVVRLTWAEVEEAYAVYRARFEAAYQKLKDQDR